MIKEKIKAYRLSVSLTVSRKTLPKLVFTQYISASVKCTFKYSNLSHFSELVQFKKL